MKSCSSFCDAVAFGFNNAFDFCGRASRSEFWWWFLFYVLASLIVALVSIIFALTPLVNTIAPVLNALVHLVLFVPSLSVMVRRLHDIDFSGWLVLLLFIPIVGALVLLYFCCRKGGAKSNRFGNPSMNVKCSKTIVYDKKN